MAWRIMVLAALMMAWPALPAGAWAGLVPASQAINDFQARLQLARLHTWSGRLDSAAALYERLLAQEPESPELYAGLAQVELARGHAAACRDAFVRALALAPRDQKLRLEQARAMNLWGDFHRMEKIYREHLARHPQDRQIGLELARLLMSAQRFPAARARYAALQEQGVPPAQVQAALCRVQWEAGDLASCLDHGRQALALDPDSPQVLALMGRACLRLERYDQAGGYFARLAQLPGFKAQGLMGQGRAAQAQGRTREAKQLFAQAHAADPQDPEAHFLALGLGEACAPAFVEQLTAPGRLPPARLAAWARVYAQEGRLDQALVCHQAALKADPRYFPSRLGLAELLGISHQYDQALARLKDLAREFPGVFKVLVTQARVLAWSRRFDQSVEVYLALAPARSGRPPAHAGGGPGASLGPGHGPGPGPVRGLAAPGDQPPGAGGGRPGMGRQKAAGPGAAAGGLGVIHPLDRP